MYKVSDSHFGSGHPPGLRDMSMPTTQPVPTHEGTVLAYVLAIGYLLWGLLASGELVCSRMPVGTSEVREPENWDPGINPGGLRRFRLL